MTKRFILNKLMFTQQASRLRHAEDPLPAALRLRQKDLHRGGRFVTAGRILQRSN